MIDEIIAIHAIVDDLLKAIRHQEDSRVHMSDAEVVTAALVAASLAVRKLSKDLMPSSMILSIKL